MSATVQNVGQRAGDEVVQLYVSDVAASAPVPIHQLQGFARIHLQPGEKKRVVFTLTPRQMSLIDERGQRVIEPGEFGVAVGGGQPGQRGANAVTGRFEISGAMTIDK